MVICDESQHIKHYDTKQTKSVISLTKHTKKRIAMTATPKGNNIRDFFSQCLFVDEGKLFGTSEWKFNKKYFIKPENCPQWVPKRKSKEIIREKLKHIAFGYLQDGILKLPPERHIIKSVEMTPEQKKRYKQAINEWEYEINNESVEINQVIVRLSKLKQIASGFVYGPEKTTEYFDCSKLNLLMEILKTYLMNKSKIVIWCSFTAEILKIIEYAKKADIKSVAYFGADRTVKENARKQFRDDKFTRLFVAQVDSGVGMNELIVSDTAIYFSNSFKVMSRVQSKGRIRRKGSEVHKEITYWDLVSEGTVDVSILKNINKSISIADFILSEIRKSHSIRPVLTPPT